MIDGSVESSSIAGVPGLLVPGWVVSGRMLPVEEETPAEDGGSGVVCAHAQAVSKALHSANLVKGRTMRSITRPLDAGIAVKGSLLTIQECQLFRHNGQRVRSKSI